MFSLLLRYTYFEINMIEREANIILRGNELLEWKKKKKWKEKGDWFSVWKYFVKVFFYTRERRGSHYINLQYPIRTRQIQLPSWMGAHAFQSVTDRCHAILKLKSMKKGGKSKQNEIYIYKYIRESYTVGLFFILFLINLEIRYFSPR